MVANDRRADQGVFEVHYLFANDRRELVRARHRTTCPPTIRPSLRWRPSTIPASRFEREIKDLFGIEAMGQPDRRPLVRHAFWPEDLLPAAQRRRAAGEFQ